MNHHLRNSVQQIPSGQVPLPSASQPPLGSSQSFQLPLSDRPSPANYLSTTNHLSSSIQQPPLKNESTTPKQTRYLGRLPFTNHRSSSRPNHHHTYAHHLPENNSVSLKNHDSPFIASLHKNDTQLCTSNHGFVSSEDHHLPSVAGFHQSDTQQLHTSNHDFVSPEDHHLPCVADLSQNDTQQLHTTNHGLILPGNHHSPSRDCHHQVNAHQFPTNRLVSPEYGQSLPTHNKSTVASLYQNAMAVPDMNINLETTPPNRVEIKAMLPVSRQNVHNGYNSNVNREPFQGLVCLPDRHHHNSSSIFNTNTSSVVVPKEIGNRSCPQPQRNNVIAVRKMIECCPVLQVYGAPLVGKSTIICQATNDESHLEASMAVMTPKRSIHLSCKSLKLFHEVFHRLLLHLRLGANDILDESDANKASMILKHLTANNECSCILVFHKCESLSPNDKHRLVTFLFELNRISSRRVSSVLSTYKRFARHPMMGEIHITMMKQTEIKRFIKFYINGIKDVECYTLTIIRNNLHFPLGVRRFIEIFMEDVRSLPDAEEVDEQIKKHSLQFWRDLLSHRLEEVEAWLEVSGHQWISLFCLSHDASLCKELLDKMTGSETSYIAERKFLQDNFALALIPGLERMQFHPLLVYHFLEAVHTRKLTLKGMWFDISCKRLVGFLCSVLCRVELISQSVGHKAAVFHCVLDDWPVLKNTLQLTIHCNHNTLTDYCKLAVCGAYLLIKVYPVDCIQFFEAIHNQAIAMGCQREAAIMEGFMAYAIHRRFGNSLRGQAWQKTDDHFKSALQVLTRDGRSFYLAQVMCLYARVLGHQEQYNKSLYYIQMGKSMLKEEFVEEKEAYLAVSDGRKKDLSKMFHLGEGLVLIFTGRHSEARALLIHILKQIQDTGVDHFLLDQVFNLLGLSFQRDEGIRNIPFLDEALRCYEACYFEREPLEQFYPMACVVPLNNMAMLHLKIGNHNRCLKMLTKALEILRKNDSWYNYYTALTLLHLSEVYLHQHKLCEALSNANQAQDVLDRTSSKLELRLQLLLHLAHIRMALDQERSCLLNLSDQMRPSHNALPHMQVCGNDGHPALAFSNLFSAMAESHEVVWYLFEVLRLGESSKETLLCDNSNHYVLSAIEHLIVTSWGDVRKIKTLIHQMNEMFSTFPWLVWQRERPEELISPKLKPHLEFYRQIIRAGSEGMRVLESHFLVVLNCILDCCCMCELSAQYFNEQAWKTRVNPNHTNVENKNLSNNDSTQSQCCKKQELAVEGERPSIAVAPCGTRRVPIGDIIESILTSNMKYLEGDNDNEVSNKHDKIISKDSKEANQDKIVLTDTELYHRVPNDSQLEGSPVSNSLIYCDKESETYSVSPYSEANLHHGRNEKGATYSGTDVNLDCNDDEKTAYRNKLHPLSQAINGVKVDKNHPYDNGHHTKQQRCSTSKGNEVRNPDNAKANTVSAGSSLESIQSHLLSAWNWEPNKCDLTKAKDIKCEDTENVSTNHVKDGKLCQQQEETAFSSSSTENEKYSDVCLDHYGQDLKNDTRNEIRSSHVSQFYHPAIDSHHDSSLHYDQNAESLYVTPSNPCKQNSTADSLNTYQALSPLRSHMNSNISQNAISRSVMITRTMVPELDILNPSLLSSQDHSTHTPSVGDPRVLSSFSQDLQSVLHGQTPPTAIESFAHMQFQSLSSDLTNNEENPAQSHVNYNMQMIGDRIEENRGHVVANSATIQEACSNYVFQPRPRNLSNASSGPSESFFDSGRETCNFASHITSTSTRSRRNLSLTERLELSERQAGISNSGRGEKRSDKLRRSTKEPEEQDDRDIT